MAESSVRANKTEEDDQDDHLSKELQEEEQGKKREEERLQLTSLIEKLEKELKEVDAKIKHDIENAHLTYNNMDAKEKEILAVQDQLNHVDLKKDLILPEFKVDFADLVDELERLSKQYSSYYLILDDKLKQIHTMRVEREKEINEENALLKEVEYLIGKEDFDQAERVLERVINHKMEEKLVKVKEVSIV